MGIFYSFSVEYYISVEIQYRNNRLENGLFDGVTTMREVFYGVISQGVAPYFMDKNKICSFFGHRDVVITEELQKITTAEIIKAIHGGCSIFYFGGYGTFDELCYNIVTNIKNSNPSLPIQRIYCVAQERYLRKRVRYFCREDYDDVIYLPRPFEGWYKSIYFRNCTMIDESSVVIFYAQERENSGAYKAYRYAKKKKDISVINVFIEK